MAAPRLRLNSPSLTLRCFSHLNRNQPFPSSQISPSFPIPSFTSTTLPAILCRAAKSPTGPVDKRSSSTPTRKKKKKKSDGGPDDSKALNLSDVEIVDDFVVQDDAASAPNSSLASLPTPTPLPKPPAGFVVDERGKVLLASKDRLATIVDPTNNLPLECVIRRVFRSSQGDECMLLCPVDMPIQILKTTNVDGWSDVSDEEVESILPAAAYALAKIRMHLVYSGFCYTVHGGFCYSEEKIFHFHPDGKEVDGLPTEGVEIICFNLEGKQYMIYTPSDPLLFIAVKDQNGLLQIADDGCELAMDKKSYKNQNQTETKKHVAVFTPSPRKKREDAAGNSLFKELDPDAGKFHENEILPVKEGRISFHCFS